MGTEHPFNPIVALLPDDGAVADDDKDIIVPPLGHVAYVFTPMIALAHLAAREKEAQQQANVSSNASVQSSRSNKSFARSAPYYMDNMSVSSRGTQDPRGNNNRKVPVGGPNMHNARTKVHSPRPYPQNPSSGTVSPQHQSYGRAPMIMMMPGYQMAGSPMQQGMTMPFPMTAGNQLQPGAQMPMAGSRHTHARYTHASV